MAPVKITLGEMRATSARGRVEVTETPGSAGKPSSSFSFSSHSTTQLLKKHGWVARGAGLADEVERTMNGHGPSLGDGAVGRATSGLGKASCSPED